MEQVLINLIKNAIQYTPEGGGIEVTATAVSHFSPAVKVSVADSGAGIPAKDRRKIFREFMIGKNSHNGEAVGLGLAVCKKIVEAHNGKIWLESAKGTGNRFIFTLPMTKP
jgi:two-component system sensor histidine kinase KdpD